MYGESTGVGVVGPGGTVGMVTNNGEISTYDDESGKWKQSLVILRINRAATWCKWSPDGSKFATASGSKAVPVCHFEEENDWWISKMIKKHKSTVLCIAWHPSSQILATGSSDHKCRVFSAFIENVDFEQTTGQFAAAQDFGDGEKNPNLITPEKYAELVKKHVMFKDMAADTYLASAGIADDWPYGRGCWQSDDKQCIVWFGEEDQLRILCMAKGYILNSVFDRLRSALEMVESIDGIEFATSEKYGYVTSCPSNLGTGMRASVHLKIPNLTTDGTDTKAKAVAKPAKAVANCGLELCAEELAAWQAGYDVMGGEGGAHGRDCSGRGICDYSSGVCECFSGFVGTRCESQTTLV